MTIFLIVAALVLLGGVLLYNNLVSLRNKVKEAFSTMDAYLTKRYDLIPNLVETVKGYAAHEQGTFEKVVAARSAAQSATNVEDKLAAENVLTGTLKSLFALAEAYPDLKANTNFMDLQAQLQAVEQDIANSRKYYNATVKEYNTKTEQFPSNIIAKLFHFVRKPMFEVESEAERQNVNVSF